MANVVSAVKAQMGDTPYYITRMTLRELVATSRPPADFDDWAGQTIEERMQRKPDAGRIRRDLIPYLMEDKNRFFGAFLILVQPESVHFESLAELIPKLPLAYREEGDASGFLTLTSKDNIVLDGQHRWFAAKWAFEDSSLPTDEMGGDEVTVIFIENSDHQKSRSIFNKINRYAKPTSRSDNIITSEDDGYFIVTRMLLDPDAEGPEGTPLPGPLADFERMGQGGTLEKVQPVQWMSTTLSKSMKNLTTISAVSDNVQAILDFNDKIERGSSDPKRRRGASRPKHDLILRDYAIAHEWFEQLIDGVQAYKEGLADPGSLTNRKVQGEVVVGRRFDDNDKATLLYRPVGQVVLVRALVEALLASTGSSLKPTISLSALISRVNEVDFSTETGSMWQGSIVSNDGRMVARSEATKRAARLLAYLIAPEFVDDEVRRNLWAEWNRWQGRDVDTDPDELEAAGNERLMPRSLPESVQASRV